MTSNEFSNATLALIVAFIILTIVNAFAIELI